VAKDGPIPTNEEIQHALVTCAAEAFCKYVEMSGDAVEQSVPMPESFMQCYCAIELFRRFHLFIALETNRETFCRWFELSPSVFPKRFKLDMLIFEPNGPDPRNSSLRMIVEFKTNSKGELLAPDAERTAQLLDALRDKNRPVRHARVGYQVVCVYDEKGKLTWPEDQLKQFVGQYAFAADDKCHKFECKSAELDGATFGIVVSSRNA